MLTRPITDDEPLEAQLVLENVVEQVAVLARITVIDLVVRAHDRASPSTDGIGKWPKIELVQSHIVDVGAVTVGKIVKSSLRNLSKMLLFVADVMLRASNDTLALNPLNALSHHDTAQDRIRTEAFPVSTTLRSSPDWA